MLAQPSPPGVEARGRGLCFDLNPTKGHIGPFKIFLPFPVPLPMQGFEADREVEIRV